MGLEAVIGLFTKYNSLGIPLQDLLQCCIDNKLQPSWLHFYKEAREEGGWSHKTVMTRLEEAIIDIYGKPYWIEVEKRFNQFFKLLKEQKNENETQTKGKNENVT